MTKIPVRGRNDSTQILMSMKDKSKEMKDVFNVVVENVATSSLSAKEINEVLYKVNEFVYRKTLEQKNPTKKWGLKCLTK